MGKPQFFKRIIRQIPKNAIISTLMELLGQIHIIRPFLIWTWALVDSPELEVGS